MFTLIDVSVLLEGRRSQWVQLKKYLSLTSPMICEPYEVKLWNLLKISTISFLYLILVTTVMPLKLIYKFIKGLGWNNLDRIGNRTEELHLIRGALTIWAILVVFLSGLNLLRLFLKDISRRSWHCIQR